MKKILSIILALTVFLSVFTVVGAADETAVEAPVSEKYINNTEMLKALGIGDFTAKKPADKVTRGEFAQIIAGLLNAGDVNINNLPFLDVNKESEYYSAVCAAYSFGIMNGVSATEFNLDGYITYEQAIKCMVCVLGYGDIAFTYPEGYINVALKINILKNLGTNSDNFTWEKVVQLVVNSFDVSIMTVHSVGTDSVEYRPDDKKTILGVYHNIFKSKGKVADNGITTVNGASVYSEDYIVVNNIAGIPADEHMREYIGQEVEFYYQTGDNTRILYFLPESISDNILIINADDLAKDLASFTKTNVVYYVNGVKREAKVNQYADMIYNGKCFPTFLVDDMKISCGTIKLIDSNNDSVYDLIIADEYRDIVVAANDQVDMIITDEKGVSYSYGDKVFAYFYDKNFAPLNASSIVNGNVISLFESKDGKYRKFVVSKDTVTGVVDGYEKDDDVERISVDGVYRDYSHTFLQNVANGYNGAFVPEMGMNLKLGLNYEGKIAVIDVNARDFMYAYCLAMAPKKNGLSNTVQLKVVTEKGDEVVLNSAKEVEINGVPKQSPSALLSIAEFKDNKGNFVPQLVRIKVNSSGEIKMLMTAQTVTSNIGFTDDDVFSLDYTWTKGSTSGRGYGGFYATNKNTVFFKILRADGFGEPEVMVMTSAPKYYANMKLYDLDEFWTAGVMVYQDYDYYTTYMTKALVVTKVFTSFDTDGNPKKTIQGYQQGTMWTYVEAEEGIIDHYIPEGVKVGDVVLLQVNALKNLTTIKKVFSLSEKQDPKAEGSVKSDGITYVYGYLCNKDATNAVVSLNNYDKPATENIHIRTVSTSTNILVYDVQEQSIRKSTFLELPINATRVGDKYVINDENVMLFIKSTRQTATEAILVKY